MNRRTSRGGNRRRNPIKNIMPIVIIALVVLSGAVVCVAIANGVSVPTGGMVDSAVLSQSPSELASELPASSSEPEPSSTAPVSSEPVYDRSNYVTYKGAIEHIFVHPLVVYPELAFDGDASAKGMDDYMTTVTEFKRMLEELYKNDYILVNIDQMYGEIQNDDGTTSYGRLPFKLPKGKKPLIISTDDMNYYQYMRDDGCNWKMVVGDDGHIAEMSVDPKTGKEVITQGNEVFSIINQFVEEHPDFSFEGAKAIVGLTGYNGILGYHTQADSPDDRQKEIEAVKPVIECLKKDGFQFASHSYGHHHMSKMSAESIREDCQAWKDEVESLIGETSVYLFPYGEYPDHGTPQYNVLVEYGFNYFSGVGINTYQKVYDAGYVFDDRKNIDGLTLRTCLKEGPDAVKANGQPTARTQVWKMMDVNYVFDKARGDEPGQGVGVQ